MFVGAWREFFFNVREPQAVVWHMELLTWWLVNGNWYIALYQVAPCTRWCAMSMARQNRAYTVLLWMMNGAHIFSICSTVKPTYNNIYMPSKYHCYSWLLLYVYYIAVLKILILTGVFIIITVYCGKWYCYSGLDCIVIQQRHLLLSWVKLFTTWAFLYLSFYVGVYPWPIDCLSGSSPYLLDFTVSSMKQFKDHFS